MYYRYEYVPLPTDPLEHVGILTGWEIVELSSIGDKEFWEKMKFLAFFEDKLPRAECDMKDTISYFTQKGNRTFSKALRALIKDIESRGRKVTRIEKSDLDESKILYRNKYQVVLRR